MEKKKTGIIGCGNISGIYFKNLCSLFEIIDVTVCADLDMDRARAKAEEFPGVKAVSVDQLLSDPEIDIVVNLTIPQAHFEVSMKAVQAGKHVYCEKPITLECEQAQQLLVAAKEKNVLVGNAPDTFLGAGIQTCRKIIDDGLVGEPIAATAFMTCHGHESWHPDPEFYYKKGGGPMFDMGPYYLTALVNLLGPVKQVTGSARISFTQRTITSAKKNGQKIEVEVPTHVAGIMNFVNGAVGTIITSFDVWGANLPRIEIYGTQGSLSVPDPNCFGGTVCLKKAGDKEWSEIELTHSYAETSRGIGVADMAYAANSGRAHRANGEMANHVLDIMHAFHDASDQSKHIDLETTCQQPAILPAGLPEGLLDE